MSSAPFGDPFAGSIICFDERLVADHATAEWSKQPVDVESLSKLHGAGVEAVGIQTDDE